MAAAPPADAENDAWGEEVRLQLVRVAEWAESEAMTALAPRLLVSDDEPVASAPARTAPSEADAGASEDRAARMRARKDGKALLSHARGERQLPAERVAALRASLALFFGLDGAASLALAHVHAAAELCVDAPRDGLSVGVAAALAAADQSSEAAALAVAAAAPADALLALAPLSRHTRPPDGVARVVRTCAAAEAVPDAAGAGAGAGRGALG